MNIIAQLRYDLLYPYLLQKHILLEVEISADRIFLPSERYYRS